MSESDGVKIEPGQLLNQSEVIFEQASSTIKSIEKEQKETPKLLGEESFIRDNLKGLPMSDLIGAPLQAACDAQQRLAASAYDFITKIGFENGDLKKPNIIKFDLERPVICGDDIKTQTINVQAPFLGLVPLPSLLIEDVEIDFQMEVTASSTEKTASAGDIKSTVSGSFKIPFCGSVSTTIEGNVSSSRENTRNTNQTAKYQVHVSARQQPPTEGLARLMDIMAQCTTPITTGGSK